MRHAQRRVVWAVSLTAALMLRALPAHAITRRDDVPDQAYIDLGNDPRYAAVGQLLFSGFSTSGTLISPKWVLTAAHAVDSSAAHTFTVGGTTYNESQHFANPAWNPNGSLLSDGVDIGLVQLNTNVSVAPASRYFGSSEAGRLGAVVGYGDSGTGSTGYTSQTVGIKRAATNVMDAIGSPALGFDSKIMAADFDSPAQNSNWSGDSKPTDFEGSVAPGDSGGGTFFDINSRTYLAGVHSFIGAASDGVANASYSDVFGDTRVSSYNQWIDDNITNAWKIAADGTFGNAANWALGPSSIAAAPTDGDIAGFNVGGTYTVTFLGSVNNYQMLARSGTITFNLNGSIYNVTSSAYDGSFVVGRYSGNNAAITLTNGILNTNDANIAEQPGSTGQVNLAGNVSWRVNGSVYLGGTFTGPGGVATLNVQNSTSNLNILGSLQVYPGGAMTYSAGTVSIATLNLSGGKVQLTSGNKKTLQVQSLNITSGQLDLADNDMIVDYTNLSPLTSIRSYLQNGSLFSSIAAISPNKAKTTLGYGEASALHRSSFDGILVDSTSLLVKYTYAGDANLDGKVDITDMGVFASHWQNNGMWTSGDFNYDGVVNITDLGIIASNWQAGVGNPLGAVSFQAALAEIGMPQTFVPEPAALSMLLLFSCTLRRRRCK